MSSKPRCFYVCIVAYGVMKVRAYGQGKWLEVRGELDNEANPDNPFQQAIDAIPGGQVSGLMSNGTQPITPEHSSYDYFYNLWNQEPP